jgi:2-polyprenyl-3-methyl-5-hydroxy-6-metoxy-1,4-benzoquinol methylase
MNTINTQKCPICESEATRIVQIGCALDGSSTHKVEIFMCSLCGHGFSVGELGFNQMLYGSGAYNQQESIWHRILSPVLSTLERRKLRFLLRDSSQHKSTVFEVGCGKGRFLGVAKAFGFDVGGIEPAERSYKYAKQRLGHAVENLTIDEYISKHKGEKKYKNVMLWHVLEHLSNPIEALLHVKEVLLDDGIAVIAVPNFNSVQAHYGGNDWYHLDPTRHLHHFTPNSLGCLASKAGFRVKKIHYNSFYQNFLGETVTLMNMLFPIKNIFFNSIKSGSKYFINRDLGWWCVFLLSITVTPLLVLFGIFVTLFNQKLCKSGTVVCILEKVVPAK